MELKELSYKLGVKNIIVSHYNSNKYKNEVTIIVSEDLAINLIGRTFNYIPLSSKGIYLNIKNVSKIFDDIRLELGNKVI